MKINDGITVTDKLKPYYPLILFGIIVAFVIFIFLLIDYTKTKHIIEQDKISKDIENKKINLLQQKKQPLMCNKVFYAPTDYDIVKIKNDVFIETLDTSGAIERKLKLSDCEIYDKKT